MLRAFAALVPVRTGEWRAVGLAFAWFYCLLAGYYVLRPVRDALGIAGGVDRLPALFTATFVAMLVLTPVFGWLTSRLPRRRFLPAVYVFFGLNLVGFYALLAAGVAPQAVADAFFVWVSVFNLFVVSVFWSFMVDLFSAPQGARLFGLIAAGGSAGALTGPLLTALFVNTLGTANLLLVSAAFLGLALACLYGLLPDSPAPARSPAMAVGNEAPIGGSMWGGLTTVARSPYLLGVCAYLFLHSALFTMLYFETATLALNAYPANEERIGFFARVDLAVNLLTAVLQLGLTARLLRWLGVAGTLATLPALAIAGFVAIALFPLFAVLVAVQIVRRAGEYALAKPARELLFSVLDREAKYKAKNFIDTVVFRGADTASGWLYQAIKPFALSLTTLSWLAAPLAAGWMLLALALGRRQRQLAAREAA
ncbi:MAG: NTP/NDP exchange transporter [Burkholderiales bacterium]